MEQFLIHNKENDVKINCEISGFKKAIPETSSGHAFLDFDAKFDKNVSEADKWDYLVSCASGVIAATLNVLWIGEFSLAEAKSWGDEKTSDFVFKVAKACGYKCDDLSDAIRKLEEDFTIPADKLTSKFGGGLQHHLRDFSHHPSPLGLVCSILSQFTKKGYGTDKDGNFKRYDLPEDAVLGKDFIERIYNGTIIWIFHLISDMAGSKDNPGKGTGIPGPILSFLKEVSALPLFKNIKVKYKDDNIGLSLLVSKLFNGSYFKIDGEKIRFDLRTEIGTIKELSKQTIPILLNECIVRCFYSIRRFYLEIKEKSIHSISNLNYVEWQRVLPKNNRTINRMLTISSGTFVAIVTSKAGISAIIKTGGISMESTKHFLLNINYFGIGRFAIALVADGKYIAEDIKTLCHKISKKYNLENPYFYELEYLKLDYIKTQALHSLQYQKIKYDINQTSKEKEKEEKEKWLNCWKDSIIATQEADISSYFIESESDIYEFINSELLQTKDSIWLYIIALELITFTPYQEPFDDVKSKKLKYSANYEIDVFCKQQNEISESNLKDIDKTLKSYKNKLNKMTEKVVTGAAVTALATITTGGLAWVFAPKIAVLLAGGSFVGLHGAALTSASLAAIGFGSVAAGGLGVAGGTAIIAGGGALFGIASSGIASASTVAILSSKDFTLNESAKLLTSCTEILRRDPANIEIINSYSERIEKIISDLKEELSSKEKLTKEEKKLYNASCKNLKYLERCLKLLKKLNSKKSK